MQYNSEDNSWSNWFTKEKANISTEFSSLFTDNFTDGEKYIQLRNQLLDTGKFDEWTDSLKISISTEKEFLKVWDGSGDIFESYQQYLKDTGQATSAFAGFTKKASTALKSFAASMASMAATWLIFEAIGLVFKAFDNWIHKAEYSREALEEVTKELDGTKSELTTINDKIAEIQAKGKLELTDKVELQKLESERSILEDQVKLLELKKELAEKKSNKDAVDTANSFARGFELTWHGVDTNALKQLRILGYENTSKNFQEGWYGSSLSERAKNEDGSLYKSYNKLIDIAQKIENEDDPEKLIKLHEKKADIQKAINEDKMRLSDIYSENLELIEQMTGDDPATQATREKLLEENRILEQYLFSAEELAQKNLTRFKEKFATNYNANLDLIQDDSNHKRSVNDTSPRKDAEGYGTIARSGVTEEGLDGLIAKNKELNQSFVDGKITTSEYFDNLSSEIEKINLDDVGKILDGGKGDNSKTDYIEETVANLAGQVSDALMYADQSFKAGETSVSDYIDTLDSGMEAQKKLLKSTYDLAEGENGLVKAVDESDLATKDAADSFNELVKAQEDLDAVDEFADNFGVLVDEMLEAGYIEGENISEKLLGDPSLFSQTVTTLSGEMQRLVDSGAYSADELAGKLAGSFGKSKEEIASALTGAKGNLEALVGENINAVNAMENAAAENAQKTISNSSQAIGRVLGALGNAISNFDYTLKATGFLEGNKEILRKDEDGKIIGVNMPASFGWTISGSGGSSESISQALTEASNYYSSSNEPIDVTDWGSLSGSNGKPTGGSPSGGKSGGSGSGSNKDTVNEQLKKDIEKKKSEIEAIDTSIELQGLRIDIADESDYITRIDAVAEKYDLVSEKTKRLTDEYNRLNAITPATEEQAETLKNRMGELVGEISNNIKETTELRRELELLSIEMISSSAEKAERQLERTTKRLDRDLKNITEGNVFDDSMFNMSVDMPKVSTNAVKKKRENNDSIVEEQQKRADEVFGIVQKSNQDIADENAVARLVEEENLAIHNENKLIEEQEYADENLGIIQGMTDGIESDITASNIFLENNPIEPQMDTTEFETEYNRLKDMVSSIQGMMNDGVPIEVGSSSARNRRYTNTSKKPNEIQGSEEGDGTSNYTMKVTSPSLTESDNLQAAYQASKLIGTPYIWGGTSTTGFDCSGLIYYVYGGLGKNIGRVADAQYHSGTPVDKSNLRMGDLVFYGTPEEATHVGMYIGKGMMIHSAGGRDNTAENPGRGVCRQSIDYRGDYLGARRYAAGTPKGNEYGKYTGIMAENYKPEILINKVTGEMTYHDTPTAFDIRKYDVMGEDMTASLPKFATGTPVADMAIRAIIKEQCDKYGVPYEIALAVLDQEMGNKITLGKNPDGKSYSHTSWQLYDYGVWGGVSSEDKAFIENAAKTGENFNEAFGKATGYAMNYLAQNYKRTGSWKGAVGAYNGSGINGKYANDVITRANSKAFQDAANAMAENISTAIKTQIDPYEGYKNKEEKKRLETYIEEYKVEDYYSDEFVNDYIPFLKERKELNQAIVDETKELYKLDVDSAEFTAKRQKILDDINTQTLVDTEKLAEISKKEFERAKEKNQAYYDGLFAQFEDYKNRVNSDETEFDEKVYTEYITALNEQADAIDNIKDQIEECTQNIIDAYEQLEEINRQKKQEKIVSMQTENEEWEQRYNIDKNPKWLRYGLENYDRIIEEEAKNKAEYHTEANDVRDQYVAEENSEIQELLQNYNDTFWEFEDYKSKVNSGEAAYDEKVFAKYEATLKDGLENIEVRDGALEYIEKNWDSFFNKDGTTSATYDEALRNLPKEVLDDFKVVISRVSGKKQGWWESEQNQLSAQETLRSEQIDSLITAYQHEIDRYQKVVEKEQERNELSISRLSAKTNLLQKHYDLTNSIRQEQHNINKELQASMTQYAYLDEETRKLLFNQEDYVELTEELTLASREAERIQRNYLNEINNADTTNIDEITAKYERQYELAMKKYEIAKAELEVSKKRQQLDNVLAEKNVRMLINGQWQWVANTQDVINAQNELADAEYAKETAELGVSQTSSLHSLQEKQNSLETANNVMNEQINDMTENLERIQEVLEGEPLSIASVLSQIAESGGNGIADIVNRFGREFTDLVNFIADFNGHNRYDHKDIVTQTKNITSPSYGVDGKANVYKSNDYMLAIDEAIERGDLNAALAANKIRDDKIDYLGLDVDKLTEEDIKKKINQRNASGTKSTKMGLSKVNEEGLELIHTNFGDLIPLEGGESIFSNLQTEKLWEWSQYRPNDFLRMFDLPNLTLNNKQGTNVTEYNLYGDVKVDSAVDADDMLNAISNRFRTKQ